MVLTYVNDIFIATCSFDERALPKQAGFRWDNISKKWFTSKIENAARLRQYADDSAKAQINRLLLTFETWPGRISEHSIFKIKDYQKKAIRFALERNRSYLALDMGLGKTAVAARVFHEIKQTRPVFMVYVCPPFLVPTVEHELNLWLDEMCDVRAVDTLGTNSFCKMDVAVMPDSMIFKNKKVIERVLAQYAEHEELTLMLVVDEAHRYKTQEAQRSRALYESMLPHFSKIVFMSGTPMPNRPIELYPVLSNAAPECIDFMNQFDFGVRYCAGFKSTWGWDFTGSSNIGELADNIKEKFMLRVRKKDVLAELPPKQESVTVIGDDMPKALAEIDRKLLAAISPATIASGNMPGMIKTPDGDELHLATYRREVGEAKVARSIEFLRTLLEETDESVLVFAHHKSVINSLATGLADFGPIVVTGDTDVKVRQDYVDAFQDPKQNRRVFIGNIQAAGTGFTLTKATRVEFIEFSWTPADNEQAADRAHRIGQKGFVIVNYHVYKNSLDRQILETNLRKKVSINYV